MEKNKIIPLYIVCALIAAVAFPASAQPPGIIGTWEYTFQASGVTSRYLATVHADFTVDVVTNPSITPGTFNSSALGTWRQVNAGPDLFEVRAVSFYFAGATQIAAISTDIFSYDPVLDQLTSTNCTLESRNISGGAAVASAPLLNIVPCTVTGIARIF